MKEFTNYQIESVLNKILKEIFYGNNQNKIKISFDHLYEYCCFELSMYEADNNLYFSEEYCENLIANLIQEYLKKV